MKCTSLTVGIDTEERNSKKFGGKNGNFSGFRELLSYKQITTITILVKIKLDL